MTALDMHIDAPAKDMHSVYKGPMLLLLKTLLLSQCQGLVIAGHSMYVLNCMTGRLQAECCISIANACICANESCANHIVNYTVSYTVNPLQN